MPLYTTIQSSDLLDPLRTKFLSAFNFVAPPSHRVRITLVLTTRHIRSKKLQVLWHPVLWRGKCPTCLKMVYVNQTEEQRTSYHFAPLSLYIATAEKAHLSTRKTCTKPKELDSCYLQGELTQTCHGQRTLYKHNFWCQGSQTECVGSNCNAPCKSYRPWYLKKKEDYPSCRAKPTCLQQFISVAVWAHLAVHAHQAGHMKFKKENKLRWVLLRGRCVQGKENMSLKEKTNKSLKKENKT